MDEIDFKTIEVLMRQGRITWAELGNILGLSAPAAAERGRQLESHVVIKQFAALGDLASLGHGLAAFIAVSLPRLHHLAAFLQRFHELSEVQESYHVAGGYIN